MRKDRSIARSLRRTTTGSTGKASLAQSPRKPGIEHASEVGLVQKVSQDALGHACASSWQCVAQEAAVLEDAMTQRDRNVLEDDEIDRVSSQALARIGEQGEALSPASVGVELFAKDHGKIDVGSRPTAARRP
jgi:hypothetical protein